ncbi:MAG: glycosyl hydrolase family 18 protein [Bacillota bacterium]|nr:glycosyl hydrolase family 18 protein [Bacillota bacterium]MDW7677160.1 glycosyl hydrolase family 18 protein [Bacillota bacterium]
MKKKVIALLTVLLALALVVTAVLSVNVELNLRIRRRVQQLPLVGSYETYAISPQVVYLQEGGVLVEPYTEELLRLNGETGKTHFNLFWLRDSLYTHHYDAAIGQTNLVGPDHFITISDAGEVSIDGVPEDVQILPVHLEESTFLPYEDLAALAIFDTLGIRLQEGTTSGHVIFSNNFLPYRRLELDSGQLIFEDIAQLDAYREKRQSLEPYMKLQAIREPIRILEQSPGGPALAFASGEDQITVVTGNGTIGVIRETDSRLAALETVQAATLPDWQPPLDEPVMLVWEAVYGRNPDVDTLPDMPGVNVVSPTWYDLTDEAGNVSSKVSNAYIRWARENGFQIWALVTNEFDIDRTHAFLKSADARQRFIDRMISEALTHGYEGINVDFEHIYMDDRDRLTHFINELAWAMRQHDLVLSMDVTIMGGSDNWSKCYDHEYLGRIVDYLIIMTYDEHWASSPVSGPVASYLWVERGMTELTRVVDPDRLVMGLNFYTRVWRERPSTERANRMVNRSTAIGMPAQANFIENNSLSPFWDEESKLYYAAFIDGEDLVKIWIENTETLSIRAGLVHELGLAGIAGWQRSFAADDVWPALRDVVFR